MKLNARVILSIVIGFLGITAAMMPDKKNSSIQLNEKQLLQEMLLDANYVSVDELAGLIISGDPSIRIIDVRPAKDFRDPIPNSINVPIDSVFSESFIYAFDQSTYKNIIVSNDDQLSTQVWMIMRQLGFANNYLLKGGINEWNWVWDP
jgi:rhodanese-related sulfurtransferase